MPADGIAIPRPNNEVPFDPLRAQRTIRIATQPDKTMPTVIPRIQASGISAFIAASVTGERCGYEAQTANCNGMLTQ